MRPVTFLASDHRSCHLVEDSMDTRPTIVPSEIDSVSKLRAMGRMSQAHGRQRVETEDSLVCSTNERDVRHWMGMQP